MPSTVDTGRGSVHESVSPTDSLGHTADALNPWHTTGSSASQTRTPTRIAVSAQVLPPSSNQHSDCLPGSSPPSPPRVSAAASGCMDTCTLQIAPGLRLVQDASQCGCNGACEGAAAAPSGLPARPLVQLPVMGAISQSPCPPPVLLHLASPLLDTTCPLSLPVSANRCDATLPRHAHPAPWAPDARASETLLALEKGSSPPCTLPTLGEVLDAFECHRTPTAAELDPQTAVNIAAPTSPPLLALEGNGYASAASEPPVRLLSPGSPVVSPTSPSPPRPTSPHPPLLAPRPSAPSTSISNAARIRPPLAKAWRTIRTQRG